MSEKLCSNHIETSQEQLLPADRFKVDAEDYDVFTRQASMSPIWGDNHQETWGIDKTLSHFVSETAGLISVMDGTAQKYEQDSQLEKPDHVIYLDKSARPVSWMVNKFWTDFSDQERPEHSYLNIDRIPWLQRAGLELKPDGEGGVNVLGAGGELRRPKLDDFIAQADNLPPETFARIRALYIPGGITTDDPEEIMNTPTTLEGKNLLIVDEVADTGTTLGIAKYLLSRAIPEAASINGDYFWHPDIKSNDGQTQKLSVPVWYSHRTSDGRGIGDVDEAFYRERFREDPTPRNRAKALGAFVLSRPVDLTTEDDQSSRRLAKDILQMHDDYEKGKILLRRPQQWPTKRVVDAIKEQGLKIAPESDKSPDTYLNVMKAIDARKPE